jgi:hypothetical protein
MVKFFTKRGRKLKGKKAAALRAKLQHHTQNLPLEISLYIVRFHSDGAVFFFSMTP